MRTDAELSKKRDKRIKGEMMDWTQTFTFIGVVAALFVYMMSRMDSHQKHMNDKIDVNQKENNNKFATISKQTSEKFDIMSKQFEKVNQRFNSLDNRMTKIEAEMAATNQRISDMKTDMNQRLATIEGYLIPRKIFHFEEPIHKQEDKSMKN